MFSWCSPHVLLVFSSCSPGVLLVFSWCSLCVLLVFSSCSPHVLLVFSWCSPHVLLVFSLCPPGDIGGQMGLFIGASILTILELFDYAYEVSASTHAPLTHTVTHSHANTHTHQGGNFTTWPSLPRTLALMPCETKFNLRPRWPLCPCQSVL